MNELVRFLFSDVAEKPSHFSCEASAFDYSKTCKMSLCFVIVDVEQDDNKFFNIAETNYFYANYTIDFERRGQK